MVSSVIAWIDVESGGTSPEIDPLLEFAALVTDMEGNALGNSYSSLVETKNLPEIISGTSEYVRNMHSKSGLWSDLWARNQKPVSVVESEALEWLEGITTPDTVVYFGGNSINLDRRFLQVHMPDFYERISHRSIDVTSVSIFLQSNAEASPYSKGKSHRALEDALDSVEEYKHYRRWIRSKCFR